MVANRVESCDKLPTIADGGEVCERLSKSFEQEFLVYSSHTKAQVTQVSYPSIAEIPITAQIDSSPTRTIGISEAKSPFPLPNSSILTTVPASIGSTFPRSINNQSQSTFPLQLNQNDQNPPNSYQSQSQNLQADFPLSLISAVWRSSMMEEAKARVMEIPNKVGPWMQFFSSFSVPNPPNEMADRVKTNLKLYYANYAIISAILLVYCLITSPILLIIFGVICCFSYIIINGNKTLQFGETAFGPHQQMLTLVVISLPIFIILGIHSVFFWLIGASTFVTLVHAVFHNPPTNVEEFVPQSSPGNSPDNMV